MSAPDDSAEVAALRARVAALEGQLAALQTQPLRLKQAAAALGLSERTIKRRLGPKGDRAPCLIARDALDRLRHGGRP